MKVVIIERVGEGGGGDIYGCCAWGVTGDDGEDYGRAGEGRQREYWW